LLRRAQAKGRHRWFNGGSGETRGRSPQGKGALGFEGRSWVVGRWHPGLAARAGRWRRTVYRCVVRPLRERDHRPASKWVPRGASAAHIRTTMSRRFVAFLHHAGLPATRVAAGAGPLIGLGDPAGHAERLQPGRPYLVAAPSEWTIRTLPWNKSATYALPAVRPVPSPDDRSERDRGTSNATPRRRTVPMAFPAVPQAHMSHLYLA